MGLYNLCPEHIKYGGQAVIECLTKFFNIITQAEVIPIHFKKGIIIPIPKGKTDQSLQDNYRGITLSSVFTKMYEKVILKRIESWVKTAIIDSLQGAAHSKCSSIHTAWLLQEIVNHNLERGSSVYIGTLDVKKAYDSVWIDGLFYQLYNIGIQGKTWRILRQMYKGFQCCVQLENTRSGWFLALQGLHQGAPCSMLMHQVYENDLIIEFKQCMSGAVISDIVVTSPAFSDDISLVAMSKKGLQRLFAIAYKYGLKWRFEFNIN